MTRWHKMLSFWGRLFLGALFIFLSVSKILQWQESEAVLLRMLGNWQGSLMDFAFFQTYKTDTLHCYF